MQKEQKTGRNRKSYTERDRREKKRGRGMAREAGYRDKRTQRERRKQKRPGEAEKESPRDRAGQRAARPRENEMRPEREPWLSSAFHPWRPGLPPLLQATDPPPGAKEQGLAPDPAAWRSPSSLRRRLWPGSPSETHVKSAKKPPHRPSSPPSPPRSDLRLSRGGSVAEVQHEGLPGSEGPSGFQISCVALAQHLNLSGPLGRSKGRFSGVWEGHREGLCYTPSSCPLPTPSPAQSHLRRILCRHIYDHRSARREKKGSG